MFTLNRCCVPVVRVHACVLLAYAYVADCWTLRTPTKFDLTLLDQILLYIFIINTCILDSVWLGFLRVLRFLACAFMLCYINNSECDTARVVS